MSYISKGRRYTYGVKTLAELRTLTDMSEGDTAFCSDNFRLMTYDGELWMCNDFVKLINVSGVTLSPGAVVIVSTTATGGRCTRTTTAGNATVVGPVVFGAVNNSPVAVAIYGVYDVDATTSTNHGDFARTSTTAGSSESTSTMGAGVYGVYVSSNGAAGLAKCFIRSKPEYF